MTMEAQELLNLCCSVADCSFVFDKSCFRRLLWCSHFQTFPFAAFTCHLLLRKMFDERNYTIGPPLKKLEGDRDFKPSNHKSHHFYTTTFTHRLYTHHFYTQTLHPPLLHTDLTSTTFTHRPHIHQLIYNARLYITVLHDNDNYKEISGN